MPAIAAVTLVGSKTLAGYAEAELAGTPVSDAAIYAEIAPCFRDDGARTDTVVLACTHYPLLIDRLRQLAPWPVAFLDPAPAIARRVGDLLGPAPSAERAGTTRAIFTSGRPPRSRAGALRHRCGQPASTRRHLNALAAVARQAWSRSQVVANAYRLFGSSPIIAGTRGRHHDRCRPNRAHRLVSQSLESADPRHHRHDGDLQSAICLDAVHRPAQSKARHDAGAIAVDVLAPDHPADLAVAIPGLSGRPFRPAPADRDRRVAVRRQLGRLGICG